MLEEILHRDHRIGRPDVARRVYAILVHLCTEVLPVTVADTDVCVDFMRTVSGSVRDALHVAVIRNNGVEAVATYGMGFGVYGVGPWPME